MSVRNLLLATVAALSVTSAAHAVVFDLGTANNATPPFSISSGGQTVTFSSQAGNGFQVQNSAGLVSFPYILLDNSFYAPSTLTISFSTPVVGAVTIPFAISDAFSDGPDTLTATGNDGTVRSFVGTPDNLALSEPEGVITFATTKPLTSLTLSATDPTGAAVPFGIGNVSVPEPVSITLLGAGLLGLGALRRRA